MQLELHADKCESDLYLFNLRLLCLTIHSLKTSCYLIIHTYVCISQSHVPFQFPILNRLRQYTKNARIQNIKSDDSIMPSNECNFTKLEIAWNFAIRNFDIVLLEFRQQCISNIRILLVKCHGKIKFHNIIYTKTTKNIKMKTNVNAKYVLS